MQLRKKLILAAAALLWTAPLAAEDYELEEMTVTANKVEESVQETSTSITVISGEEITDAGVSNMADLSDMIPNLLFRENGVSGAGTPSMRGMSSDMHSRTVSTAMYIDGVPYMDGVGYADELVDVERVEVLRGPQGTLYGKNAEAGVINIITRKPDNEFRGQVSTTVGSDGRAGASMLTSGALVKDQLYMSISGNYNRKDGVVEHAVDEHIMDNTLNYSGRAYLRWTPLDDLDISLISTHQRNDDKAPHATMTADATAMFTGYGFSLPPFQERKSNPDYPGWYRGANDAQAFKIDYDINDELNLTSLTTYRTHTRKQSADWDFSPLTLMHFRLESKANKLSQELRFSADTDRYSLVSGLYYDRDKDRVDADMMSDIPGMSRSPREKMDDHSWSAFFNLNYALTDSVALISGVNYARDHKEFQEQTSNLDVDEDWSAVSPKIGVEYQVNNDVLTYFTAAKGYRPGGFDLGGMAYDEENLWSYEIGAKTTFLDKRVILNGAIYHMDVDDMQVIENVTAFQTQTTNAGRAEANGIEVELLARPVAGLTLQSGIAWNDIRFTRFSDPLGDYKGNFNPNAPKYTLNLGAQYRHANGLYVRGDVVGYGKMYLDKANTFSRGAYNIMNAKIGYEADSLDVYLYSKNVFDRNYDTVGYSDGTMIVYRDPREVGISLTCRF